MTNLDDLALDMTKRDFIAAIASLFIKHEAKAKGAVMYADALIAELNKPPAVTEPPVNEESLTAEQRMVPLDQVLKILDVFYLYNSDDKIFVQTIWDIINGIKNINLEL